MNSLKKTSRWLIIAFTGIFLFQCQNKSYVDEAPIAHAILQDRHSFFYLDTENYPKQDKSLPIGVFDSGTGVLTVLDAILDFDQYDNDLHSFKKTGDGARDFKEEYFIYRGDQANMPYGRYSGKNKTDLLKEHIIKDVQFLLGNKYYLSGSDSEYQADKSPVKAVVIACNTATAYGKADIEDFIKRQALG